MAIKTPKNRHGMLGSSVIALIVATSWPAAHAAVISSVASGDWSNTGTWTGGTVPVSPTNAALIASGHTVSVTGSESAGDGAANPAVEVANGGALLITGTGSLTVQTNFHFRIDGGGSATVSSTSGSALSTAGTGAIQIGNSATLATLTQTAGTINTSATLAIGAVNNGARGKFDMQGGVYSGAAISVGSAVNSVGELAVSGSASISIGFTSIAVAGASGSTGTLNMTGGSIASTNALNVGGNANATGTVNHSGGTISIGSSTSGLTVGNFGTNSTGIYNLSGTGIFEIRPGSGANIRVGNASASANNNFFNMTGGTVRLAGSTSGNVNAATPTNSIIVGDAAVGTWDQSAGSVIWIDGLSVVKSGGVIVGNTATSNGEFKLSGTGTVTTSDLGVANRGDVLVGKLSSSSNPGKWTQSGGVLTVASNSAMRVGGASATSSAGYGLVTLTGGTIHTPSVILGDTAGSSGTWNQSGGTLNVTHINQAGAGDSSFNLSGSGVVNLAGQWTAGGGTDTRSLTGGTINTNTGNDIRVLLVNAGSTISPGGAGVIGTGNFTTASGNYQQDAGVLLIDILGNSVGQFDRLLLTNTAGQAATFNGGTVSVVIPPNSIGAQVTPGIFDLVIADTVTINVLPALTLSDPHFQGFLTFANSGGALLAGQESLRLVLTNVPEPASAAVVGIGLALMLRRRSWGT